MGDPHGSQDLSACVNVATMWRGMLVANGSVVYSGVCEVVLKLLVEPNGQASETHVRCKHGCLFLSVTHGFGAKGKIL